MVPDSTDRCISGRIGILNLAGLLGLIQMDDFIAKLPTRQTASDYLEKLGVRPVGSSSETSWQKIDLYELAQVSLDSLSDSLSCMSSWVAVCPPFELQYQRSYHGSKQRITDSP
jgi:hypothetical protein